MPTPPKDVTVYEMRHVVDFFSMTFGLCGLSDQPCDFSQQMRGELSKWFREESLTSTWIRATSPHCNCSNNFTVPYKALRANNSSMQLKKASSSLSARVAAEVKASQASGGSPGNDLPGVDYMPSRPT